MDADIYAQVKTSIKRTLHIDLERYKEDQMKRRLDSWLARTRVPTWNEYFGLISKDARESERFRNYLTINVTEFFRDLNRWDTLRSDVMPYLLQNSARRRRPGALKLWSAGCSIGSEPYTMAIMMEELAPPQGYRILATDLDRGALAKAKARGPYTAEEIRNLSPLQRRRYITPAPPFHVVPELQKSIDFHEQNMLEDVFQGDFDLIVCRNVVIYFTADSKEVLFKKFSTALCPGGVLFVGGTEIISSAPKYGLENFGTSFYKRI